MEPEACDIYVFRPCGEVKVLQESLNPRQVGISEIVDLWFATRHDHITELQEVGLAADSTPIVVEWRPLLPPNPLL